MGINGKKWEEIQKIPAFSTRGFQPGAQAGRLALAGQGNLESGSWLIDRQDRASRIFGLTDLERESTSATRRSVGRQVSS